jgi:hypothetical protein
MVSLDAEVIQALLHCNADGAAATPETDQEIRMKSRITNLRCESKRVDQQIVRGDEFSLHCFSGAAVR